MEPELPHYQFHRDTDGSLHMAWRAISEAEVVDVLEGAPEEQHRRDGRVVALGRTADGRFLRVVYRILPETGTIFDHGL